jgi:coenzyme F420-0:L-glutamate ligase/coenzyme F420-1:gamma-L-glutamate ligase
VSVVTITPITGIPEVSAGDDIADHIATAAGSELREGDVVIIAHKIVSKAEGRLVEAPNRRAAVLEESSRILRRAGEMLISETRHGFVCANAGVDASNVVDGQVALLPVDPDLSARRIRARLARLTGQDVAIIISDTFGRAWRIGQTNVAIGVAGIDPFVDYRGSKDTEGNELVATRICIADELAGAAEMVMGKALGIPAAIVRGAPALSAQGSAGEIVRPPNDDLFR